MQVGSVCLSRTSSTFVEKKSPNSSTRRYRDCRTTVSLQLELHTFFFQNLTFAAKMYANQLHTQVYELRNNITKDESLQMESNVFSKTLHLQWSILIHQYISTQTIKQYYHGWIIAGGVECSLQNFTNIRDEELSKFINMQAWELHDNTIMD